MYLKANPRRRRTEEEEKELRQRYKPGESVLPPVAIQERDPDDERMLAEVRELSLREVGVRGADSYERGTRHRTADRRRDQGDEDRRSRGQQQSHPSAQGTPGAGTRRQIGHQSSLRSLMSSSDIDSSEMEEEILRLVDEGWLDGIDLNNLDTSQVDELSEKIADAYRRRHGHRSEARRVEEGNPRRPRNNSRPRTSERSNNRTNRSTTATEQSNQLSHPPVSRPRLLEAYPTGHNQHRRASSEQRRQSSPSPRSSTGRISSGSQNQASRSAIDLSERPSGSVPPPRPSQPSGHNQRTTDPDHRHRERSRRDDRSDAENRQTEPVDRDHAAGQITARTQTRPVLPSRSSDPGHIAPSSPPLIIEPVESAVPSQASVHTRNQTAGPTQDEPVLFTEPAIECNRCGKKNLEYELHWNCPKCYDGKYNICLSCYRLGRGCLQWYGFGYAALQRYQRDAKDLTKRKDLSPPHTLVGHRYKHPEPETAQGPTSEGSQKKTTQDPKLRLQAGAFCAICLEFTDDCFWKCGSCNEGEWGFCNRCVNQGRCCTHPLLPVAHDSSLSAGITDTSTSSRTTSFTPTTHNYSRPRPQLIGLPQPEQYIPLTLSTKCNICEYPIPPSTTRFHCPQCNAGDFNICTTSYLNLLTAGRLSPENGDKGWRRCPNGHRMIVIGFEDTPTGQRRVLVKDLVGGHTLKNDGNDAEASLKQEWSWQDGQQRHTRTVAKQVAADQSQASPLLRRYPPSGGVGMHVLALWGYWPREEARDELAFPKGAEIREAENINGDWFVGCYAGRMGLFPGNYVRVLDVVRS
ncbi:MAG: hypothetical protein Q9184_001362 [Pyrenodesmia sp. 2 TL-2023]